MKRSSDQQGDGDTKRFKDEPQQLVKLDSNSVETFIVTLKRKAGKSLSN